MVDPRHPDVIVHTVTTLPLRSKLIECCLKRDDAWGSEVMNRLHGCIDLVAAEAVYHDHCLSRFLLYKELSAIKTPTIPGRHSDEVKTKWFELLCDWLNSTAGAEMCSLKDLHNKMAEISGRSEIYSMKRIKQKLLEHYDDSIFFAEVGGCDN